MMLIAPLFQLQIWWHAQVLMIGSILMPDRRTLSSVRP
jgi:hypothetical protein